ncbi:kinesin-like protein KIN-5B [Senna tora]|uniref:Kinesin-like protein KIN-5B n=1 Tax=Senna tora TaxID=362788 RepID=A0A834WIQ4_9FABA|nr:kinesin-like protein KIN-5B [Senna tora]
MSVTPDQSKKVGLGMTASPSPFLTPRPERRRTDSRGPDFNSNRLDKDKETNVQVLLRCRPLSEDEQKLNVPNVVSCNEHKREVTVASKQVDRIFAFDKVFGPKAQQRAIYDQAIAPIVNEVLDGYNCTIFAYGQTGTGKTYTMEGGMRNKGGDLPAEAGVIPRAVRQIFDMLEAQNADYSMKVTFLELYNEDITDLLAPEDNSSSRSVEEKQKKPLSLMEDGKGCVVVRGLEEESVYGVNEIYALLERGASKRRTAETLLNKRSSRSHSVLTITIYVKEAVIGGEELIKCGKLNLVDLAGSENILRSGAREGRAREAGEINKSLLTLGRVINALVEHSPHIPYRDSKLTRILRDSLGGKTKTCIIATISPSAYCLEETLSTLDYASRAKNIKNKPEANQKVSKAVLLKDLYMEIERMKEDVRAAREKNGVYVPHERFAREEAEKKARNEKIEQLESELGLSEKEVEKFRELYLTEQEQKLDLESELKDCKVNLEKTRNDLHDLQENYRLVVSTLKEKELTISKLLKSENSLIERAKELCTDLQNASDDITSLSLKLDQKDKMEEENQKIISNFGSLLNQRLEDLHKTIMGSISQQQKQLRSMEDHASSHLTSKSEAAQALESRIKKMTEIYTSGIGALKDLSNTFHVKVSSDMEQIQSKVSSQTLAAENFLATAVLEAKDVLCNIQNSLDEQKHLLAFSIQQQEEGLKQSLSSAQVISEATLNFFNDIHQHSSRVMKIIEETQNERTHQLVNFEKLFKEETAREEEQALEKIAAILAALTSKRTARVSEASRNMQDTSMKQSGRLQLEMCNIQQVSKDANKEVGEYLENVKSHYTVQMFSASDSRALMENCLMDCSKRVDYSREQWENAQSSLNNLNKNRLTEIENTVKTNINSNYALNQEFVSASSCMASDYDAGTHNLLEAVNDSLMVDHENKKEIDSISRQLLEKLHSVQEKHGESILSIQAETEKSLEQDYLVDEHTSGTPKKRMIVVPSLVSIEEMRTQITEDNNNSENNRSKWMEAAESKIPRLTPPAASPNRTPFAHIIMSSHPMLAGMKRQRENQITERDLAISLMLLSQQPHQFTKPLTKTPSSSSPQEFECKTCNRKFSSFQALGGHRASHKKPKLNSEEEEDRKSINSNNSNNKKAKMHECSICGQEFSLGQALGGHMRKHRAAMNEGFGSSINEVVAAKVPVLKRSNSTRVMCLDLNLTPLENDLKLLFGKNAPQVNLSLC